MGLFSLFGKAKDMNDGVAEARSTEGAFLIDVREPNEFASGPDAIMGHLLLVVTLTMLAISAVAVTRSAPIFLYCASGVRSARAADRLRRRGYTNVRDIGGIKDYTGPLE